jgi:hypothetical protein
LVFVGLLSALEHTINPEPDGCETCQGSSVAMHRLVVLLCALFLVAACASKSDPATEVLPGEESSGATAKRVINTVGTPVHALIKGVACVGGTIVAVPTASALTIAGGTRDKELRRDIYNGVGRTCGGSYTLGSD